MEEEAIVYEYCAKRARFVLIEDKNDVIVSDLLTGMSQRGWDLYNVSSLEQGLMIYLFRKVYIPTDPAEARKKIENKPKLPN